MAWETRKGQRYFYRSVRDGDIVHKVYVGCGDAGRAAELALDVRREQEQQVREWLSRATKTFAELDAIDAELAIGLAAELFTRFGLHMDVRAARRTIRKLGDLAMEGAICDPPLSPDENETWRQLRERASRGDPEATEQLLPFLDRHPQLQTRLGDLSRHALNRWLDLAAGRDEAAKQATHAQVMELIGSLQQNKDDPLEQLLTRRIGLLWLQVHFVDVQLAMAVTRTHREQAFLDKRRGIAQAAYATAIQTLGAYQRASGAVAARK